MTALHKPGPGRSGRPAVALVVALFCFLRTTTPAVGQSLSPQDPPASLQQEGEFRPCRCHSHRPRWHRADRWRRRGVALQRRTRHLAKTTTDGAGQVTFPFVPAGRHSVRASRPGFRGRRLQHLSCTWRPGRASAARHHSAFVAPAWRFGHRPRQPKRAARLTSDMLSGRSWKSRRSKATIFRACWRCSGRRARFRWAAAVKGGEPRRARSRSAARACRSFDGRLPFELPGQSLESVEMWPIRSPRSTADFRPASCIGRGGARRVGVRARQPDAAIPEGIQRRARLRATLLGPRTSP